MKNALDWIKSNPISAASLLVAFFSVVVFLYVLFVQAPALRARVIAENEKSANELRSLTTASYELPNSNPNEPPISINDQVINEEIVTYVETVYQEVSDQSAAIKGSTETHNAGAHRDVTFAGGDIFGGNSPKRADIVRATQDYRNSFEAMFTDGYDYLAMPRMQPGLPPTVDEVQASVDRKLVDYLTSVGAESADELTQTQADELLQLQRVAAMAPLRQRAQAIHIYADVMPLPIEQDESGAAAVAAVEAVGMDRFSQDYPFEIADWSVAAEQAKLDQLWEGQVQIWIIRDVMQAIANTNTVQETSADGTTQWVMLPVIDAPVKRLMRLDIEPGYVGLHTGGAINPTAGQTGGGGGGGFAPAGGLGRPDARGGRGGRGGRGARGGAPGPGALGPGALSPSGPSSAAQGGEIDPDTGEPIEGTATPTVVVEVSTVYNAPVVTTLPPSDQPAIDSFFFGPTGRFSNNVFDVRHATLKIHIEWESLPLFFEQLRQVNFMTVIDMTVKDIDEYEAMADGYVYGSNVVEVEIVIETLWFRNWTTPLMPQLVQNALAVPAQ